jgi:hypothetical protein
MSFPLLGPFLLMSAFRVVLNIGGGIWSAVKFVILSVLSLMRWCWDRIHMR